MPFCASCGSEYENWVAWCDDCGLPLRGTQAAPGLSDNYAEAVQHSHARVARYLGTARPIPALPRHLGRNRRLRLPNLGRQLPVAAPLPQAWVSALAANPAAAQGERSWLGSNPPPARSISADDAHWLVLTNTPNEMMAQLIKSQLDDAAIPSIIKLSSGTDNGEFINNAWVARDVWVQAGNAGRARQLVDFYRGQATADEFGEYDEQVAEPGWDASLADGGPGQYREREQASSYAPYFPDAAVGAEEARYYRQGGSRSLNQGKLLRWVSFALMLVFVAPYLIQLLQNVFSNLGQLFGG